MMKQVLRFQGAARTFTALFLATVLVAACAESRTAAPPEETTIILIRHADRDVLADDLNEVGRTRAAALPAALADVEIDAIYSPDLARNLQTVAPLARVRDLEVMTIEVNGVAERLVGDNPGKTVLWVGNTTNLPGIYQDLGGAGDAPVEYGDLFFVKLLPNGSIDVERAHFGP